MPNLYFCAQRFEVSGLFFFFCHPYFAGRQASPVFELPTSDIGHLISKQRKKYFIH